MDYLKKLLDRIKDHIREYRNSYRSQNDKNRMLEPKYGIRLKDLNLRAEISGNRTDLEIKVNEQMKPSTDSYQGITIGENSNADSQIRIGQRMYNPSENTRSFEDDVSDVAINAEANTPAVGASVQTKNEIIDKLLDNTPLTYKWVGNEQKGPDKAISRIMQIKYDF